MAISFEDSLKAASMESSAAPLAAVEMIPDCTMMTAAIDEFPIAAYSGDMENWVLDGKYRYYSDYSDDRLSVVDENKNITLSQDQINLTQESNSQFIPFQMPRYYDGFDLSSTRLFFHYVNKDGYEDLVAPINVYTSSDKIKFGWLIDGNVTAVDGKVRFEIQAMGSNSKGDVYVWKTKPSDGLNILKSLSGSGIIEPDSNWISGFLSQVTEQVSLAQQAAQNAESAIAQTQESARAAQESAETAASIVTEAKAELSQTVTSTVDQRVAELLGEYYTDDEVDDIVTGIHADISSLRTQLENTDGLANFNVEYDGNILTFYNGDTVIKTIEIASDPTDEWTSAYTATVDDKLSSLETKIGTTYATKVAIETIGSSVASVEAIANTNKSSIATLGTKVAELEDSIADGKKDTLLSYEATYDETYTFRLLETERTGDTEVTTVKSQFVIAGGSGSGSTASILKIEYVTKTPYVVTVNDDVKITYNFSGTDSSGDAVLEGTATWKVNNATVATQTIAAGENTFDITDYISIGTQKVLLSIADDNGSIATKSWTVQKIDVRLESTFNDGLTYPMGDISFDYTPYGAIQKDVYFFLDGEELGKVTTSSSGLPMAYTIPAQEHGSHLLEAYIVASLNNGANTISSNKIVKDIVWYDASTGIPVISCAQQNFTVRQYDTANISFVVHDPKTETPAVTLAVDGKTVSELILTGNTYVWQYKSTEIGDHTLTITCGETVKTLKAKVEELDIKLEPVTAGLVFDFNPTGMSNDAYDRTWSDGDISMRLSDNFDWVNGGYHLDSNGDSYFCIKAGTSAEINYQLFADDAKRNGKEFKLVFKTTNVARPDATFLHCMDNTTGSDHIGIRMDVHEASIFGQAGSLKLPYSEEDIIEFEFNISKNTEAIPMVMGYEDGVSTRPMVYDDSYSFTQNSPKTISIGSEDCDLHIYRFKVYNSSLTAKGILNNFIADARNAEEMIARYDRNQIYDENQNLDPDVLAAKCPWLRVYKISAPYFTNNKSDKVPGTTIQQIYKNGDATLDNWTCYNAQHSGQGTSSNNYGAAGRNLDFIMNNSGVEGVSPYFVLGDGSRATEVTMTRTSVPVAYLNAKVNIASSNNMTNAMLANRYNQFEPYKRPFVRPEGVDTSFIKDTMEFHNCVIFIQETDPDLSTHREFADTNYHFYALGNIGDSKKTDDTRLTDPDDKYECCVEIMDVELPLSDFPVDTMMNAMGYKLDETTQEKIYTWAKNENLGILYELIDGEYVLTEDETVDLNKVYYVDILEHDDFSEDYTYGWRYISDDEDDNVVNFCKQKWIELYRFITTSSDEEFKSHLGDYFVVNSALYYYLFTTRYCMVDNRAKNSFWHYGKTGEVDDAGNPVRKWNLTWGYDMDSSLGLNNYGMQTYRYGLEDTDVDAKGEEVFRESDSTFFCRIRDLFPAELKAMYQTLESKNAWHAESFINQADAWQSEFPEELWRVDIERKYIRTYTTSFINGKADAQFLVNMANGKMKYHRRGWERDQEKYMASKYQSSVASSDNSVIRCAKPAGELVVEPNYKLRLIPYAYMYLNVKYGTQSPIQMRAEPNIEYEIPYEANSADIIDVYSSSLLRSFGDLSSCYAATVDTSKASKIKELTIGNKTDGYDNPYLTTLTTGANYLLEKLNVENVSGLTQSLDLSALSNLKELYAHGSNVGGVTFADGGKIEIAELPAINAMTMRNLIYLTTLDITSFEKLTTLIVENCGTVDLVTILDRATNINRVRIIGINWSLADTTILERLYAMKGIDKNGYNVDRAVVSGKIHVPGIKQQALYEYRTAWPDLEITFDTMTEQFPVTFVNHDGSVLEVQYVDKGGSAIDPTTRAENQLIPTKESSVSHDFTFAGWDSPLNEVFTERTIMATYSESLRRYTIKYVSKGITMQESTGLYGENIPYTGANPTYTSEESYYSFYLFNRWDKSGFIDGDKTVNAIFDKFTYTSTSFDDKELSDLTPVEIYAMNKLGLEEKVITDKDPYRIVVGNDVDYDDIDSELLISEKTYFDGSNHIDTGIQLLNEDRDFVLAIDYEFLSGTSANSVLAQCFQANGTNGFKLWYGNSSQFTGARFTWGSTHDNVVGVNKREVIVVRHTKGSNNTTIYKSNLDGDDIVSTELVRSKSSIGTSTLVFGCAKADDGRYENHAIGNVNWAKVWFADLGDDVCRSLAIWPHESISLEACGFRKYYLSNNTSKRCSFSLLASHLLGRPKKWNNTNVNTGGFAASALNASLNTRLYNAMPTQIKSLLKQVIVYSSAGQKSSELVASDCYITIPSIVEVSSGINTEPYNSEGVAISYMTDNNSRKRAYDGGDYSGYWLRSPNADYANYIWRVEPDGSTQGITNATSEYGILIEISF